MMMLLMRITQRSLSFLFMAALTSVPAFCQADLTGEWNVKQHEDAPERGQGPELGDYAGIPINDSARLRADSWDASLLTLPEWQCRPHPADYGTRGPANLRIWKEIDTPTQVVIAFHTHVQWQAQERTIWMDGRPHPPEYAPHTWQGFSTGKWEGGMLTVYTTHLKMGFARRNGTPRSDEATMVEHWIRHGDYLTLFQLISDPVYFSEPYVRSTDWVSTPDQTIDPYPCEVGEEVERAEGLVPHHLPGTNTFINEMPDRLHLPLAPFRGGAATMYPEYALNMTTVSVPPVIQNEKRAWNPDRASDHIDVLHVRGGVYMLTGAGANIAVQVGNDGVFIVDTGIAKMTDKVVTAIRELSSAPIHFIINTSADPDHTGGNLELRKLGVTIAGGDVKNLESDATVGAQIIAHENVLNRMSASVNGKAVLPFDAWPTETYHLRKRDMFFNDEAIQVIHQPAAHTDGDSILFFRRSDVVVAGDLYMPSNYPVIDLAHGGNVQGVIEGLNRIIDLTIPAAKEEGGTMVIPAYGRLADEADVAEYRDMMTIIRDRVQNLIAKGMTLEQVKAARPTLDYDPRYGTNAGAWTTDMFVEAVYKSLSKQ
jgi:glyoxylase-like metal-dependent hydrolase (beta-lactamase superfamily II)